MHVVSENRTVWLSEILDTLGDIALLPDSSIIVSLSNYLQATTLEPRILVIIFLPNGLTQSGVQLRRFLGFAYQEVKTKFSA